MSERAANISMELGSVQDAGPLLSRAEAHDGSSPVSDQAMLAVSQGQRELFLFRSASGTVVAAGIIGQGELDLVVDPEHRSHGVGTAALELLLEHNRAGSSGNILAWAHGVNPAANALLERAKFTPVRSLYRMALDPDLLPAAGSPVTLPAGFTLRNFDPSRPGDAEAWVRVNAAAFATHPEQGRISVQDFALMRKEPWYDDADLFLLETDDGTGSPDDGTESHLVGYTWVKTQPSAASEGDTASDGGAAGGNTETELYAVGVDPEYAGKGLGRTLLDVTLARMADHDPSRVTLYVDGENERAVRMYETAGFTIDSRSRQWQVGATG